MRIKDRALASFLVVGTVLFGFSTPLSATVIDQNFVTTDDPNHNTGLGFVTTSLAQTFTVGVTGTLASVEFNVLKMSGTTGDLSFDIRSLVGGVPDSLMANALATSTISNSLINTFGGSPYSWTTINIDVSAANIAVAAGDMFAFVLNSPIGEKFGIQTDYNNAYAGGQRYSQNGDGTSFYASSYADLAFKTTVNAVPEPSVIALFGLGLLGLGIARGRQKRV